MGVLSRAKSVVEVTRDRNVTFLSAGLAYYAFISLFPLVILVIGVGTFLFGQGFTDRLISLIGSMASAQAQLVLARALGNTSGRLGASLASIVVLLWGALKLFRGLVQAFEEVYERSPDSGFVESVKKGLVTLVAVVLAVALIVVVQAVLGSSLILQMQFGPLLQSLVLLAGLVVAFLPLYYFLPPVDMTLSQAMPGAVFAAVGWAVFNALFQLYLGGAGKYGVYGMIGTIIVFLTWLYFSSVVLLVGAVVNLVFGRGGRTSLGR